MSKEPLARSQIDKFRDAARELQTDDDPERFAARMRKLAKAKPEPKGAHGKPTPDPSKTP